MTKKKGITLIVIVSVLVLAITLAVSYAYWSVTKKGTQENVVSSGCFDMEITGERNAINLQNAYPITDSEANSLTPYSFTIKNTCDIFASYEVNLEVLAGSTLSTEYVAVKVNNEAKEILGELDEADTTESGSVESRTIIRGALGKGDEAEYTLRIWLDQSVTLEDDAQSKTLESKIVLVGNPSSYSPSENGITLLNEALLVNEYQVEDVNVAKQRIQAKGNVDTSKTAPIIDWRQQEETQTTITVTRPSCEYVGNYGITNNNCKLRIGTGLSLEEDTGYFNLTGYKFLAPETLDFENNDYYFLSGFGFYWNSNGTVNSYDKTRFLTAYKIINLTTTKGTTTNNGNKINTNIYKFTVIPYTQYELESDASDKGLYAIADDYTTDTNGVVSYMYRGNVKNNYVSFGGYIWKVVRINGDGSIRLLYDRQVGETQTGNIGQLIYNNFGNNPAYIGYMYGSTLNTSYEQTISNDVDSVMKTNLESWYETNIENKNLSKYIADSGFCNDRSLTSGNGYSTNDSTYYNGNYRFAVSKQASLVCPNPDNDLFTTENASIGNKALTYPIGLITMDELQYSGISYGYVNKLAYTYSPKSYYTMTPEFFRIENNIVTIFAYRYTGAIGDGGLSENTVYTRPVINLKADTEITGGIGTSSQPFIVNTSI